MELSLWLRNGKVVMIFNGIVASMERPDLATPIGRGMTQTALMADTA
jgi:hypothetical protein